MRFVPTAVKENAAFETVKGIVKEVGADDLSGLAAEMTYRLFLAIVPFLIFLTALGGIIAIVANVQNPIDQIMEMVQGNLPPAAAAVLEGQLREVVQAANVGILSLSFVGALWASAGAMQTLMKALNRVFDVDEARPFWKRYPLAIGMTLLGGTFLLASLVLFVLAEAMSTDLAERFGLGGIARTALLLVRWPVAFVIVTLAVAYLYRVAPNTMMPWRWAFIGGIVFAATWLIAAYGFTLYVTNFGNYGNTYGALAGVVLLLLWIYISSFVLLLVAEVAAVVLRREKAPPDPLAPEEDDRYEERRSVRRDPGRVRDVT